MNKKQFEIWEKQKRKEYSIELAKLQEDFASRGLAQSGFRNKAENDLRERCEGEIKIARLGLEDGEENKPLIKIGDVINSNFNFGTQKNKIEKHFNFKNPSWLEYLTIVIAALGILWAIYIYFYPNPRVVNLTAPPTTSEDDLRNKLVGSIFNLSEKIHDQETELARSDLVGNYKGREFTASGSMFEIGKFSNGEIWVDIRGNTSDGSEEAIECHFDKSWEGTIRNLLDMGNKNLTFSGVIGYYTKGWLIAQKCGLVDMVN